jgi:hypothetical protein
MYKHGEPSKGFSVVDLSSEEEDAFTDTSRDEEVTRKIFGALNHGLLGPPGDGNIIILSDSDEEEGVRKDDHSDTEVAPSSARNSPASIGSTATDDDAPNEVQDDSSDGRDEASTP